MRGDEMPTAGMLDALSIEQAMELQFKLVDCIHRNFPNGLFLQQGDLGLVQGGSPLHTTLAEQTLAQFFGAQDCVLVRGAGTGAIREALGAVAQPGGSVLVHAAPIYPSTEITLRDMALRVVNANYNDLEETRSVVTLQKPSVAVVQHARQLLTDSYSLRDVIATLKGCGCQVVVDDNYAVLKTPLCGIAAGADLAAFSLFKLQGPEGIGCVLGKRELLQRIRRRNCTGGSQVQGMEAMEALRSLVNVPVAMAVQAMQTEQARVDIQKLADKKIWGIRRVFVANMQSRVLLVEFEQPIAYRVLSQAEKLGASPRPVGAESKYEIPALFYTVSRTFAVENPERLNYYIRINVMRAGADTVVRILKEALKSIMQED
jgi:hypothetical protein